MYFRSASIAVPAVMAFLALSILPDAAAQNRVTIDAGTPAPAVSPVAAHLGTNRNPQGHVLSVNSQYLTLDGKPWLPVMGELHYSRVPESEWESSILKMKAAGVQIIASYVIWIHHEQTEGVFDWKGQKDLHRFAELCAKHEVYFYPRIGPWAHGEVRNGGLPDWVLAKSMVRKNDPIYLAEVRRLYAEIGKQLQGLYWKDGGPIIGIQIENEYRGSGPGSGAEHIRTLKQMALAEGMDVPLYTVTGWDKAAIPLDEALPVFGGYPDAPWDASSKKLPPADVYSFRFANRAAGSMGAIGGSGQSNAIVYQGTPFLTAEIGGGIQDTYFRRPVVTADDIAAMIPVMLGSGANLLGYYMFHGGRNPDGGAITLQESQRTGYPTDVPVKLYDFQAPISPDGEQRESLNRIKLVHYFLNAFGDQLATMNPYAPEQTPVGPEDLSMPRVAARMKNESGYLFLNNYVRGIAMPDRPGFSVQLKLADKTIQVPNQPIDLPSGAYGIWPVNLPLNGATLRYSTAQLITKIERGKENWYFFFGLPGIVPEFWIQEQNATFSVSRGLTQQPLKDGLRIRAEAIATGEITLTSGSQKTHLVLLTQQQAKELWKTDNPQTFFRFAGQFYAEGNAIHLLNDDNPKFDIGAFRTIPKIKTPSSVCEDLFQQATFTVTPVSIRTEITEQQGPGTRSAWAPGADLKWRATRPVMAPEESEFDTAAAKWKITVKPEAPDAALNNILLRIRYRGDIARLYQEDRLLNDDFWNGLVWETGLKQISMKPLSAMNSFILSVLPLPKEFPMYLEKAELLHTGHEENILSLDSVEAVPQYQLTLTFDPSTGTFTEAPR